MAKKRNRIKWVGTMKQDLTSYGHAINNLPPDFKKGDMVTVWKKRVAAESGKAWNGEYEYHYSKEGAFCRSRSFLLEEFDEPDLW